jgi:hypothetical protein
VNLAVERSIGILDETRRSYWTSIGDERRNSIGRAIKDGEHNLRIGYRILRTA